MKNNLVSSGIGTLTLSLFVFACQKAGSNAQAQNASRPISGSSISSSLPAAPFPQSALTGCSDDPSYGDSIIYPQPAAGQDYTVKPINNPGPGRYLSWPGGMHIDSVTGVIDLTASETGQRYAIGFVKAGSTDTCVSSLILGGASYMDSIYNIASGSGLALPYFDADPAAPSICGMLANGSPGCSFDVTGSATNHKMVIDKFTGAIDLKKSLNGIFGGHPVNGQTAAITIYYQLNDASNMALQHILVDVIYYDTQSAMNAGLVGKIKNKHAQEVAGLLISPSAKARPPLIIIVRHV